jgi:DNA-binding NarL/FixJ family response regulator
MKGTILIIENDEMQRNAIHEELFMRGFSVVSAGTAQDARKAFADLGEEITLMVIDMSLEDKTATGLTGADLALEFCESRPSRLPEFLILSAFSFLNYYKLAIRLGAAAYLSKDEINNVQLIQHIRSLLIKRNLSGDDQEASRKIGEIVETSRWLSETPVRFCREIVSPVLSEFLGAPFVIIVNDGRQVHHCFGDTKPANRSTALYENLDRLIHGKSNQQSPYIVDKNTLDSLDITVEKDDLAMLEGAAFLPIVINQDMHLAIGILKSQERLAESPKSLADVLKNYLQRAVLDPLLCALRTYIELKAKRETELVAQSCAVIGQEQQAILSDALEAKEVSTESHFFRRLMASSEDLRDTGQILMMIGRKNPRSQPEAVRLSELLQMTQEELQHLLAKEKLRVEGDCVVDGFKDELMIAVSRIVQFLVRRMREAAADEPVWVQVSCRETANGPEIAFRDYSRRLPAPLRERLFSPFAEGPLLSSADDEFERRGLHLPLYLAKSLVEVKHGGTLEDHSDALADDAGHCFVMRFPLSHRMAQ